MAAAANRGRGGASAPGGAGRGRGRGSYMPSVVSLFYIHKTITSVQRIFTKCCIAGRPVWAPGQSPLFLHFN